MIRTNQRFLEYAELLFLQQPPTNNIATKQFAKGEKLLTQDIKTNKVMLIKAGLSKCFISEENGKDYIIEFLGAGEIIGDIECIRNIACLCSVEALTEVTVFVFSVSFFQQLLQSDLKINGLLIDAFAGRIINTSIRASYQQLYTVEHSFKKLLELQEKYNLKLSKDEMASYLGVTTRTLNRCMKNVL